MKKSLRDKYGDYAEIILNKRVDILTYMKFVIFHGAFGAIKGNWFPWLKAELEKLNQQVILKQFPVDGFKIITENGLSIPPKNQNLSNWFETFEKTILPKINKEDRLIVIGHSLGSVFYFAFS